MDKKHSAQRLFFPQALRVVDRSGLGDGGEAGVGCLRVPRAVLHVRQKLS